MGLLVGPPLWNAECKSHAIKIMAIHMKKYHMVKWMVDGWPQIQIYSLDEP